MDQETAFRYSEAVEERGYFVYMLASRRNGTRYVGVTSKLAERIWEHKEGLVDGFNKRHRTRLLVWYEVHDSAYAAITREKQLKRWNRAWKIRSVETMNPYWNDLSSTLVE